MFEWLFKQTQEDLLFQYLFQEHYNKLTSEAGIKAATLWLVDKRILFYLYYSMKGLQMHVVTFFHRSVYFCLCKLNVFPLLWHIGQAVTGCCDSQLHDITPRSLLCRRAKGLNVCVSFLPFLCPNKGYNHGSAWHSRNAQRESDGRRYDTCGWSVLCENGSKCFLVCHYGAILNGPACQDQYI